MSYDDIRIGIEKFLESMSNLHTLNDNEIKMIASFMSAISLSDQDMKDEFFRIATELAINNVKKLNKKAEKIVKDTLKTSDNKVIKDVLKEIKDKLKEEIKPKKKIILN